MKVYADEKHGCLVIDEIETGFQILSLEEWDECLMELREAKDTAKNLQREVYKLEGQREILQGTAKGLMDAVLQYRDREKILKDNLQKLMSNFTIMLNNARAAYSLQGYADGLVYNRHKKVNTVDAALDTITGKWTKSAEEQEMLKDYIKNYPDALNKLLDDIAEVSKAYSYDGYIDETDTLMRLLNEE